MNGGCKFPGTSNDEMLMEFESALLLEQLQSERSFLMIAASTGRPSVVVMDRGLMDIKAYLPSDDSTAEEQLLASAGRYEEEHKLKLTQLRTSDAQTGPRRAGGTGGRAPHAPCHGLVQRQRSRAAPSVAWPAPAPCPPLPPPADPRLTPSPLLPPGCTACCSAGTSR